VDEADVAVWHHGLESRRRSLGTHNEQGLRRRDHAADRVDRELLHHAYTRSGQTAEACPLLGIDKVWARPFAFC